MNKGHGSTSTLGKLSNGIEIHIRALNSITINTDGNSATVGGGAYSQELISYLWGQGKASGKSDFQTFRRFSLIDFFLVASGSCACVGLIGSALGGGMGRYQGFYGLLQDNIISADLVLGDGTTVTVSESSNSDLFWGFRGAGHNFGIVTRFDLKIFDSPVNDWYFARFIFTQDKLETFVTKLNDMMGNGTQPKELMNYFIYAWDPAISTTEVGVPQPRSQKGNLPNPTSHIHISQLTLTHQLTAYCRIHHFLRRHQSPSSPLHPAFF